MFYILDTYFEFLNNMIHTYALQGLITGLSNVNYYTCTVKSRKTEYNT